MGPKNICRFFICIEFMFTTTFALRTCTVIAPEFIHSARTYSLSLAVNNVNISSEFEVTIDSTMFKESRTIELQPNGVKIIEFDLPFLSRDEYTLRVKGVKGIHVERSKLLKYAVFKPSFIIQTDKYFYRRGETLHYRILCLDENYLPLFPHGIFEIKIMTQHYRTLYYKKISRLLKYLVQGELYLNNFEISDITSIPQYVARISVYLNSELQAAATFQIENFEDDQKSAEIPIDALMQYHKTPRNMVSVITEDTNNSTEAIFSVQFVHSKHNKTISLNKMVAFKIKSRIPFEYFFYTIIGRGKVVQSERIQLLQAEREFSFKIKPINQMAPVTKLIVYFIDENNDFHYDVLMFNVEGKLENNISLSTPHRVLPNKKFDLNIRTKPNSYVGVLAIEEMESNKWFKDHDNDISLRNLLQNFGGNNLQRGEITGSFILTTAENLFKGQRQFKKTWIDDMESNLFPIRASEWKKTWFYAEISNTSSESFILPHNLPNEDSTWRITAFALHPENGLAFVKLEPSLRTTRSYNITIDLPEFIYQNEIINIPIRIDNLLNEDINIRIEFVQEDYEVELMTIMNDGIQSSDIGQKSSTVFKFAFRSVGTGMKSLKFLFFSLAGDDREIIKIVVKPKGLSNVEKQCFFIDLLHTNSYRKDILPKGIYNKDTMTAFPTITAYVDLMEPILEFISKETHDKTAEQVTSTMALTCLARHYLELTNRNDVALETQLLRNMHKSYFNLFEYRDNKNGSFNHFLHSRSATGSIWLTAYIVTWLPCVKKFINIDETSLEADLDYLASTQNSDGSFQEKGLVLNSLVHNNTLGITAHVLLAFLENKIYYTTYKSIVEKGIIYIVNSLPNTESLYERALSVYVIYKAGLQDVYKELDSLERIAQITDEYKFWAQGSEIEVNNVATTALVLLTAIGVNDSFDKRFGLALKWLIEKGGIYNFEGRGLYPTQATVFSVEVLLRTLQRIDVSTKADLLVGYRGLFRMEYKEFELKENVSRKQFLTLKNYMGGLEISATGQGYALALATFNYQILKGNDKPNFEIIIEKPNQSYLISFFMKICVKYEGNKEFADLTILNVNMPSGYVVKEKQLQTIVEKNLAVQHATINSFGSEIKFFLLGLQRNKDQCISIEPFRVQSIAKQISVPIACYEYTDVGNVTMTYYNVELTTCELCNGRPYCMKNCFLNN